jgi:hypothetical protein
VILWLTVVVAAMVIFLLPILFFQFRSVPPPPPPQGEGEGGWEGEEGRRMKREGGRERRKGLHWRTAER